MLASGNYRLYVFSFESPNTKMTTSDQENIERKLNHVLEMGEKIIDLYRHITCTERAALLLAMMAAVRQTAANMRTVAAWLRKNLLDTFRIDYTDYARRIENLCKIWDEELGKAPIFHNLDRDSKPIYTPNDIALKEDTDYDLTLRTEETINFDMFKTRVGLMDNAPLMSNAIEKGLEQISRTLREIESDYQLLKTNVDLQDKRLQELERYYETELWEEDIRRFAEDVEEYVEQSGDKSKSTYQRYLGRLERDATDTLERKALGELNEWFLGNMRPAAFIVENRDKLTFEDIALHFRFVRCRRLLQQHVERFDLLLPADNDYKDLFVNRAAQELAYLLSVTIGLYVDFRHNYQYAALQMAMQDLGLVYNDSRNGTQMRDFINKTYLKNDKLIKDQKTLTDWTGKLLGSMFGTMDERHLQGNYSLDDFKKMKDYYWLCLSIINKIVQVDLMELQFAPYLYEEHEKTPSIADYKNSEGRNIMDRLFQLKSVISGDSPFR